MKKRLIFIASLAMLAVMTACGNDMSDSLLESSSSSNVRAEASTTENESSEIQTEVAESFGTDSGVALNLQKKAARFWYAIFHSQKQTAQTLRQVQAELW